MCRKGGLRPQIGSLALSDTAFAWAMAAFVGKELGADVGCLCPGHDTSASAEMTPAN